MSLCNKCNDCNSTENTNCNICIPCSGPNPNIPVNPILFPIMTKRILNCINLDDIQCKFLGKFTFDITSDKSALTNLSNTDICINSTNISYDFIGIKDPKLTITINGKDVLLSDIYSPNGNLHDKYEGIVSPGVLCCCPDSTKYYNNIISLSGVEMYMLNGIITICGTIGCKNITAKAAYDGFLNSIKCSKEIVNISQALQNTTLLDTSDTITTTVLPSTGILNKFNPNNYFGKMCLPSLCKSSNLVVQFNNQICITCVQPTESYDYSGSFTANVYGCFISTINLTSILKDSYPIYAESYNDCTNDAVNINCNK